MPVQVQCPNPACGRTVSVPDDCRSLAVHCESCGRLFPLPPPPAAGNPPAAVAIDTSQWQAAGPAALPQLRQTGRTLARALQEAPINWRQGAEVVRSLAEALATAHEQGIVHGDVNPDTILLDAQGRPSLTSFGATTRRPAAPDAACYRAPEQAAGQPGPSRPAGDQYSLGAVLYRLLCGEPPFVGPPNAVPPKLEPPRERNPYVPQELERICLKALSRKPEQRYPSCRELADDLQRWLDMQVVGARRPPEPTSRQAHPPAVKPPAAPPAPVRKTPAPVVKAPVIERKPVQPRRKDGLPAWVWAAAAVVVLGVVLAGVYLAFREKGEGDGQPMAQNEPLPPPTPVTGPGEAAEKPPDEEPKGDLELPAPGGEGRLPVPDAETLARAEKDLHERFKDLYAGKSPLLRNKLDQVIVHGKEPPALRYVALKELQDLAAQSGDIRTAMQLAGRLSEQFQVDRLEAGREAVQAAAGVDLPPQQVQAVLDQTLWLAAQARAEDRYDLALRLAKVARTTADKVGKPALVATAGRLESETAAASAESPAVQKALATLAKTPDDPGANRVVGLFRCLHQDAWEEGLPLLAKGSDEALKALAVKDLADPAEGKDCKEVADGWWALAEREKGAAQQAFSRRAYHWYERAAPKLTGGQTVARERLEILAREVPELLDPWHHLDLGLARVENDALHLEPNQCVFTRRWYRGGIDVTLAAKTAGNSIRLMAGTGGAVVFNAEGMGGGMRIHRPDNSAAVGRTGDAGSLTGSNPRKLEANKWYTLRWRLAPTGMKVWIDGELVFEKEETYALSSPRPVGVCSSLKSPIDLRSLVVKPLPAAPVAGK